MVRLLDCLSLRSTYQHIFNHEGFERASLDILGCKDIAGSMDPMSRHSNVSGIVSHNDIS